MKAVTKNIMHHGAKFNRLGDLYFYTPDLTCILFLWNERESYGEYIYEKKPRENLFQMDTYI